MLLLTVYKSIELFFCKAKTFKKDKWQSLPEGSHAELWSAINS